MFSFFMNEINFYFCDLFIVMMLRNQSYPPDRPVEQSLIYQDGKSFEFHPQPADFDLDRGRDNNVNRHKKDE